MKHFPRWKYDTSNQLMLLLSNNYGLALQSADERHIYSLKRILTAIFGSSIRQDKSDSSWVTIKNITYGYCNKKHPDMCSGTSNYYAPHRFAWKTQLVSVLQICKRIGAPQNNVAVQYSLCFLENKRWQLVHMKQHRIGYYFIIHNNRYVRNIITFIVCVRNILVFSERPAARPAAIKNQAEAGNQRRL